MPTPKQKPQNKETAVHIRWMIRRDMKEVLAIEKRSFEFPWTEGDLIRALRHRNCIGMVAEHGERVVGFMVYELHKDQLRILNFAVDPEFRRSGVGRKMANKLIGKLTPERRNRIILEIRETNLSGQVFFSKLGFRAVSVLRDYYDDTTEDAYVFQYRFGDPEEIENAEKVEGSGKGEKKKAHAETQSRRAGNGSREPSANRISKYI